VGRPNAFGGQLPVPATPVIAAFPDKMVYEASPRWHKNCSELRGIYTSNKGGFAGNETNISFGGDPGRRYFLDKL